MLTCMAEAPLPPSEVAERYVSPARGRSSPSLQYEVAKRYYLDNATQAQIGHALGLSRTTISRLLADARAEGIVRIEIREPSHLATAIREDLCAVLGLRAAYVEPAVRGNLGPSLALGVRQALRDAGLVAGDALLVSSGKTILEISHTEFPPLPGVIVAPMVGGQQEQQAYYQTNEIARQIAMQCGGIASLLYAPAQPSAELYDSLIRDPSVRHVIDLWTTAKCALMGVGAPPLMRSIMPPTLSSDLQALRASVGDISHRPFDRTGAPISFSGTQRLIATSLEELRNIPVSIAVAVGTPKVVGLVTAARAGYYNTLVTDMPTAQAILEEVRREVRED